ncbi:dimethylsulfonioproprionate lyase family protein [Seohaeicola nanhaiensis]|uniref:Dimethylsulfonioproprionate lyase family protein n=1 Tax=Seohaeicola nanhaiensis TaxID=1387282 RepID=A0ABV9KNG5_9RHOB
MTHPILGPGAIEWLGTWYSILLSAEATGGSLSVVDSIGAPDSGPPRHVHHDADETFVLLSGACDFWLEGETFRRGAGSTVFVPRGKEHTFRVVGPEPSRHLVLLTPGGFEGFFVEMARRKYRIPQDMTEVIQVAQAYRMDFTGPPLAAETAGAA